MIHFTSNEKKIITIIVVVILFGSLLNFAYKRQPHLSDLLNSIEKEVFVSKVNINTATDLELQSIPFIGPYTSSKIINHRHKMGSFKDVSEVAYLKGVHQENYQKFKKYLKVK